MEKPEGSNENSTNVFVKFGLHDKNKNTIKILSDEEFPTNISVDYELFGVTRDSLFTANTSAVDLKIQISNTFIEFLKRVRFLLYLAIIPGVLLGLLRVVELSGIIELAPENVLSSKNFLNQFIFWLSVFGAQILWYDLFFEHDDPDVDLDIQPFSTGELSHIQQSTVDFSIFTRKPLAPFIHNFTADIIAEATIKGVVNLGYLWRQLMSVEILHRAYQRVFPIDANGQFIDQTTIQKILEKYNIPLHEVLIYAIEETALLRDKHILPEHLFATIWKLIPELKEILYQQNFTQEDIRIITQWIRNVKKQEEQTKFWKKDSKIKKTGGIVANWIYGYTYYLNKFSKDLTEEALQYNVEYGIGHLSEINEIIGVIGKSTQGNVLLVGESGTGKTSLVKGIAQRIIRGEVPEFLREKRIISVNIAEMIANAANYGGLEGVVLKTVEEITKSGNAVLFIDELHTIVGAAGEGTTADLSNLMVPFISNPDLKIIGTTTYQDYKSKFESGGTLAGSFDIIEVKEPNTYDTIRILETFIPGFEHEHGVFITFPAIKSAVVLSQKYISTPKLPNKAISLLEETCVKKKNAVTQEGRIVTPRDVQEVVSAKTNIPVTAVGKKEAKELLELDSKMKEKIVGQEEAIEAIVEALKRARSGIRNQNRPIATFLFMGPTGVGKTHIARTVADLYFGGEKNIIRLDMSEYQESSAITRIIGSDTSGNNRSITLIDYIRQNPHTLILLDELEKAHKDLLNVFLQLFDEGRLTDTNGQTVNFTNTIIIATSNIGTGMLQDAIKEGALFQDARKRALLELKQNFRPEFLNRFDQIIVFHPLTQENLVAITKLQLNILTKRLEEQGIHMTFTDQVPVEVAKLGYTPDFGAREINRVIQDEIEQKVANMILEGKLSKGDKIEVTGEWVG